MEVRDWFELLRMRSIELDKRKAELEGERAALGPRGVTLGSIGSAGHADGMASVDALIERELEYDRDRAEHDLDLRRATHALYGRDGRGGLARARSMIDADILCCHYLQGMTYAQIADGLADSRDATATHWCTMRAMRALAYMDRVGLDYLSRL